MENKKTSNRVPFIIIIGAALFIVIWLIIGLAPVVSEAYSVNVTEPVQVQQPYTETVSVPIQESQSYTVDVTDQIQSQQPLTYQITNRDTGRGPWDCVGHAYLTVKNTDTLAGTFIVNYTFWTAETVTHDSTSIYVLPGEWQTAEGKWPTLGCWVDWDWSATVQPQTTKTVTTYSTHTETRYRTVITGYQTRQETHYRTVTENRTHSETRYHKVSLLKSWMD